MPIRSDELWHSGVKGSEWGVHKVGKWDKRAIYAKGKSAPKSTTRIAAAIDRSLVASSDQYKKTKEFKQSYRESVEHVNTGGKKPLTVTTTTHITSAADVTKNITIEQMQQSMEAHDNEDKYRNIEYYAKGFAGLNLRAVSTALAVNVSLAKEKKALTKKSGPIDPVTGLHYKSKLTDADSDAKLVNPGYVGDARYNTTNNCYACSVAYELRRRGYDATVVNNTFSRTYGAASVFKGLEERQYEYGGGTPTDGDIKYILDDISKQGAGARGMFNIIQPTGGGHSMTYEVDPNKQVVIRDAQTGLKYDAETVLKDTAKFLSVMRLDNCDVIPENVHRFAQ